jgi:hypothetical protein
MGWPQNIAIALPVFEQVPKQQLQHDFRSAFLDHSSSRLSALREDLIFKSSWIAIRTKINIGSRVQMAIPALSARSSHAARCASDAAPVGKRQNNSTRFEFVVLSRSFIRHPLLVQFAVVCQKQPQTVRNAREQLA